MGRQRDCPACKGSGDCRQCGGSGKRGSAEFAVLTFGLGSLTEFTCKRCDGTGKCQRCGGNGHVDKD